MATGFVGIITFIFIPFLAPVESKPRNVKSGALPSNLGSLRYHPNMTSLWVMDERGWIREAYLRGKPPEASKKLEDTGNDVSFFLYTRDNNIAYELVVGDTARLSSSSFNPSLPCKVVIHGFWNSYQSDSVQNVKEAYIKHQDVNVIAVDWGSRAAGPWYSLAVSYTKPAGIVVANMIDFLVTNGADISSFHLIGHSLGAHVAAFAANNVESGPIPRITGNDPALPMFLLRSPKDRLDSTDAQLVDCIHTCGGYLGFYTPLCSVDFYPNGGTSSQPACSWDFTGACSHSMSFKYFSASLAANFTARSCSSFDEVRRNTCNGQTFGIMGDPAPESEPGMYYLETSKYYPYAQP